MAEKEYIEIVRCKDCMSYVPDISNHKIYCGHCKFHDAAVIAYGYCHMGFRKGDAE